MEFDNDELLLKEYVTLKYIFDNNQKLLSTTHKCDKTRKKNSYIWRWMKKLYRMTGVDKHLHECFYLARRMRQIRKIKRFQRKYKITNDNDSNYELNGNINYNGIKIETDSDFNEQKKEEYFQLLFVYLKYYFYMNKEEKINYQNNLFSFQNVITADRKIREQKEKDDKSTEKTDDKSTKKQLFKNLEKYYHDNALSEYFSLHSLIGSEEEKNFLQNLKSELDSEILENGRKSYEIFDKLQNKIFVFLTQQLNLKNQRVKQEKELQQKTEKIIQEEHKKWKKNWAENIKKDEERNAKERIAKEEERVAKESHHQNPLDDQHHGGSMTSPKKKMKFQTTKRQIDKRKKRNNRTKR